jgi:hypothetical protein
MQLSILVERLTFSAYPQTLFYGKLLVEAFVSDVGSDEDQTLICIAAHGLKDNGTWIVAPQSQIMQRSESLVYQLFIAFKEKIIVGNFTK